MQILLNYGVIILLLILVIYSIGIYRAFKANNYWLVLVYMMILVHSMTEPRLFNLAFNPLIVVAFSSLMEGKDVSQA